MFRKTNISYPLIGTLVERYRFRIVSGESPKTSFFGKFVVLSFLVTSVLRLALLPYYLRIGV